MTHHRNPSQRASGLERFLLADLEAGIDRTSPATVTIGEHPPRRDGTIPAAPLGWTRADDAER